MLTKLWSDFTSDSHSPPTFTDLIKFLKRRSQAVESLVSPKPSSQNQTLSRTNSISRSSPKLKALHVKDHNQDLCPCCNSSHHIYHCSQFKSLTTDKRYNLARRNHLCFNCLSKFHSIEDCSSKATCRECGRKHHSLLHKQSKKPSQSVASSSTTSDSAITSSEVNTSLNQQQSNAVASNSSESTSSVTPSHEVKSLYQQRKLPTPSFAYMPATALATL